ncbi:hypothetical protein V8E55_008813 [Tylopilus felleus]
MCPPTRTDERQDALNGKTNALSPRSSPAPAIETEFFGPGEKLYRNYHMLLNGCPCDAQGTFLLEGAPPPIQEKAANDWSPFESQMEFELADFLYTRSQMPGTQIDILLDIWAVSLIEAGGQPLFSHPGSTHTPDHQDVYRLIDSVELGDVKWDSFTVHYTGDHPANGAPGPPWMDDKYYVYFRNPRKVVQNILGNPDFSCKMDYHPYREFISATDEHQWCNFMSGDWAWNQADLIAQDPATHGSVFVPVILGSDKPTVSMATGQNDFYPLYLSIRNVRNNVQRAHRNALVLIGFLAMPKSVIVVDHCHMLQQQKCMRRQLFHSLLSLILQSLKQFMTNPDVVRFGNGYYHCVIYRLGPYIADYEEQVLLACIVRGWCAKCLSTQQELDMRALYRCKEHTESLITQLSEWFGLGRLWDEYGIVGELVPFTNDFPRADIHKLLALDLLHQIIKGAFKDHFVEWVERYIHAVYGTDADAVLDDIDRRITAVAPFSGLRRFPQGRHFKQWTGDDSKALMKVYLPAIEGHVPHDVVRALRALLKFCYLVRHNIITDTTLAAIKETLERFHQYRQFFYPDIMSTFSLPRQHAMTHYPDLIHLFGAPNGLCSSITELKHIKAVKRPYRCSNHHNALGQMLVINQQLDKLVQCRVDFNQRRMLDGTCVSFISQILARANEADTNHARPTQDSPDPSSNPSQAQECYDDGCAVDEPTQRKRARTVAELSAELEIPQLGEFIRWFLFQQSNPQDPHDLINVPLHECPMYDGKVKVFNAASMTFYAPSDISGVGGMRR